MVLINSVLLVCSVGLLISAKTLGGATCFGLAALSSVFGIGYGLGKARKHAQKGG